MRFQARLAAVLLVLLLALPLAAGTIIYSNTTSQGYNWGPSGATGPDYISKLAADDLQAAPGYVGWLVTDIAVMLHNSTGGFLNFEALARFWDSDGGADYPGTYLYGFSFGNVTFSAGESRWLQATVGGFPLPSGMFWAGIQFSSPGISDANFVELMLANPPSVGTSSDMFFRSAAAADLAGVANPTGAMYYYGGDPVANFAWELGANPAGGVIPEPATAVLFGAGLFSLAFLGRRRARR